MLGLYFINRKFILSILILCKGGAVSQKAQEVNLPKINDFDCARLFMIDTRTRICAGYNLARKGICSVSTYFPGGLFNSTFKSVYHSGPINIQQEN